jgi:hypothetical protein
MPKKLEKKSKKEKGQNTDLWGNVTCVPVLYKINDKNTSVTFRRIKFYA